MNEAPNVEDAMLPLLNRLRQAGYTSPAKLNLVTRRA